MSFFLYLLLMGLSYFRIFELFLPDWADLRPMLVLTMLTLVFGLAARKRNGGSTMTPQHNKLMGWLLFMIFFSAGRAAGISDAINGVVNFMPNVLMVFVSGLNLTTFNRVRATVAVILTALVASCALCIYSYHTGYMVDQLVLKESTELPEDKIDRSQLSDIPAEDHSNMLLWRIRSAGTLADPNDLSQIIVFFMPLLFAFWDWKKLVRSVLTVVPALGVFCYSLFLAHSRGALLGLGMVIFTVFRRRLGPLLSGGIIAGMFLGAMALQFTGGREVSAADDSSQGRLNAWYEGIQMLKSSPIYGIGYRHFTDHNPLTAHNTLVIAFAEIGLLGFWIWLGLNVVSFRYLIRVEASVPPDSEVRRWATLTKAGGYGLLVCGMFLSRAFEPATYLAVIMTTGMAHAGMVTLPQSLAAEVRKPIPWRGLSATIALLTVSLLYILLNLTPH